MVGKERKKLQTAFDCPMCDGSQTIAVRLRRTQGTAALKCTQCPRAKYDTHITPCMREIDVFAEWYQKLIVPGFNAVPSGELGRTSNTFGMFLPEDSAPVESFSNDRDPLLRQGVESKPAFVANPQVGIFGEITTTTLNPAWDDIAKNNSGTYRSMDHDSDFQVPDPGDLVDNYSEDVDF